MTGCSMMKIWLKEHSGLEFTQANLQLEVHKWQWRFGKHYLPESISRYFRMVRDRLIGFICREVKGKKHKTWIVEKI